MSRPLQIAVIGAAQCDPSLEARAQEVGRRLAEGGAVVLCGGRGGVMAAAAAGAREAGGTVIGVLPGADAEASPPNPHVTHTLFTGLGQARNQVLVLSAAAVVAVGGSWGTLNEIATALKHRRPVIALDSWQLTRPDGRPEPLLSYASTAEEAAKRALEAARSPT
ncbi:MAG: TIGR00725 family protein [Acidobacteria bacterium]|nr:TIGR00725 family protein [Acidobacteriota bacterium]